MPTFRIKCRNVRCSRESLKYENPEKFDEIMDGRPQQYKCESCGFPNAQIIISGLRVKDGFTPGWQENIREHAGGRKEYDKKLREKGLEEIGYDYIPQHSEKTSNPFENEEILKEIAARDKDMSDRELDALKSGELLKDVELDKNEQ